MISHTIDKIDANLESYDWIVLLQPTTPKRNINDFLNMKILAKKNNNKLIVSTKELKDNPYFNMFFEDENKRIFKIFDKNLKKRRQDVKKIFAINGSIYFINYKSFFNERKIIFEDAISYKMNELHSIDIDNIYDFIYAETLIKKNVT